MNMLDFGNECCEKAIKDRYFQEFPDDEFKKTDEPKTPLWYCEVKIHGREVGFDTAGLINMNCIVCNDCVKYYTSNYGNKYVELNDPEIIKQAYRELKDREHQVELAFQEYRRLTGPKSKRNWLPTEEYFKHHPEEKRQWDETRMR